MTATLLDVNVLIALAWTNHDHHEAAVAHAAGFEGWATTPVTEAGFVRLSMNANVVQEPTGFADAIELLRQLTEQETHEFWPDDCRLLDADVRMQVRGHRQVTDAHLIAIAAKRRGQLATFDSRVASMLRPGDRHLVRVLPS